jgi:hypothetical protein
VFVRQKIRSVAILAPGRRSGRCSRRTCCRWCSSPDWRLLGVVLAAVALLDSGVSDGIDGIVRADCVGGAAGAAVGLLVSLLLRSCRFGGDESLPLDPLTPFRRGRNCHHSSRRPDRQQMESDRLTQVTATLVVTVALVGVAAWQAASGRAPSSRLIRAVALVLHLAGGLVRAVRPFALAPWFPLRHAVIDSPAGQSDA